MSSDEVQKHLGSINTRVDEIGEAVKVLRDGTLDARDVGASITIVGAVGSMLMSAAAVALLVSQMVSGDPTEAPAHEPAATTDTDTGEAGDTDTDDATE